MIFLQLGGEGRLPSMAFLLPLPSSSNHIFSETPSAHLLFRSLPLRFASPIASQEARLADQRRREEAGRMEALRASAEHSAQQRTNQDAQSAEQLERMLAERRERERLERQALAQGQAVEQNSDVLNMLNGAV